MAINYNKLEFIRDNRGYELGYTDVMLIGTYKIEGYPLYIEIDIERGTIENVALRHENIHIIHLPHSQRDEFMQWLESEGIVYDELRQ